MDPVALPTEVQVQAIVTHQIRAQAIVLRKEAQVHIQVEVVEVTVVALRVVVVVVLEVVQVAAQAEEAVQAEEDRY